MSVVVVLDVTETNRSALEAVSLTFPSKLSMNGAGYYIY